MFGRRDAQVQSNIVDKQLQIIFHIVRVSIGSPQPAAGSRLSIDGRVETASLKLLWRMACMSSRINMVDGDRVGGAESGGFAIWPLFRARISAQLLIDTFVSHGIGEAVICNVICTHLFDPTRIRFQCTIMPRFQSCDQDSTVRPLGIVPSLPPSLIVITRC